MEDFGFLVIVIFIIGIVFAVVAWTHERNKKEKLKDELYKIVEQSGASNIEIHQGYRNSEQGIYSFAVTYTDSNGHHQRRHVTRHMSQRVNGTTDFLWDKPLFVEQNENVSSRLSNKEQIISDMDAEIQRLRAELENARQNN